MLLEDSPPKRTFAYFRGRISRGELVQMIKPSQWIVAYSSPPVFIDCQKDQVKIINPCFLPYLLAVENSISRYDLFINKLDFLTHCIFQNVGDKVDVILEPNIIPSAAVIRYKGKIPNKRGIFFGVEILVSYFTYMYVYSSLLCIPMYIWYHSNANL